MNMCPGAWFRHKVRAASARADCDVTPHAQKTGTCFPQQQQQQQQKGLVSSADVAYYYLFEL